MTSPSTMPFTGKTPAPAARLEPDAIGVAQDTVIGMASSAPAVSVGITLAALTAATAYAGGPVIILTAIPMLIIANAQAQDDDLLTGAVSAPVAPITLRSVMASGAAAPFRATRFPAFRFLVPAV